MSAQKVCDSDDPEHQNEEEKTTIIDRYIEKYKIFCYHFGHYVDRQPQEDLAKLLYRADMEMTPGMFVSLTVVTAFLASVLVFVISSVTFHLLSYSPLYPLLLTLLTFIAIVIGFISMLYNKISSKNMNIDMELPYALGYMSILASAGSTPLQVIRRLAAEDYGDISIELRKVIYRVDLLGEDGISAMNYLILNTSSESFRTICIDINNTMQSGGGLKTYLEMKSKDLMEMRRQSQEHFVDSLSVYGEGYMSTAVMGVVLVVLTIVVASALGIDLILKPGDMFNVFIYVIMPFVNIFFLVLLWMKYSRSTI
ncbi:type II secretion system F family protein [Methanohalophilus sp.]